MKISTRGHATVLEAAHLKDQEIRVLEDLVGIAMMMEAR